MTYEQFLAMRGQLDAAHFAACDALKALVTAAGGPGPMGLTPDAVKFSPEGIAARRAVDQTFQACRTFNRKWAKTFRAQERDRIQAARLAVTY